MTNWEYHYTEIHEDQFPDSADKLGAKGWELVACHIGGGTELTFICIFKRPLPVASLVRVYGGGGEVER